MRRDRMVIAAVILARDEERIIGRCLDAALAHVDEAVVVDTGSTDGTVALAKKHGASVFRRRWVDFGHNRTQAIRLTAEKTGADYLLLLDADDELAMLDRTKLRRPSYNIVVVDGGPGYVHPRLISTRLTWRCVGVTHEYLTSDRCLHPGETETRGVTRHHCDGSRRPRKFAEDAAALDGWLATHPDDARAVFYLANTYRDLGRTDEAIALYWRRVMMGGWPEEILAASENAVRLSRGDVRPVPLPSPVADTATIGAWPQRQR